MLTLKFLTSVFMFLVLNLGIRLKLWNNSNNKRKAWVFFSVFVVAFLKGVNKIAQKVEVLLVKPTGTMEGETNSHK